MSERSFMFKSAEVRETYRWNVSGGEPVAARRSRFQPERLEVTVVMVGRSMRVSAALSGPGVLKGGALGSRTVTLRDTEAMPQEVRDFVAENYPESERA